MQFIKRFLPYVVALIVGSLLGWLYWYYWGCTESCPIRSNPLHSSLYGALLGVLFMNIIQPKRK
jgi:hypothetical protein